MESFVNELLFMVLRCVISRLIVWARHCQQLYCLLNPSKNNNAVRLKILLLSAEGITIACLRRLFSWLCRYSNCRTARVMNARVVCRWEDEVPGGRIAIERRQVRGNHERTSHMRVSPKGTQWTKATKWRQGVIKESRTLGGVLCWWHITEFLRRGGHP